MTFAVDVSASGFNLNTVGVNLMVAGALGVVLSLLFWSSFSTYRRGATVVGGDTVVSHGTSGATSLAEASPPREAATVGARSRFVYYCVGAAQHSQTPRPLRSPGGRGVCLASSSADDGIGVPSAGWWAGASYPAPGTAHHPRGPAGFHVPPGPGSGHGDEGPGAGNRRTPTLWGAQSSPGSPVSRLRTAPD